MSTPPTPPPPTQRLKRTARRTVFQMREEIRLSGGHMVHYGVHPQASAAQRHAWDTVESKGFLVLKGGCVQPHKYYRNKGLIGPARIRGPAAAVEALVSPLIDRKIDPGRDSRGWPCRLEISHLCHNPHCCAPGHLVIEQRWKNWRRNYCSVITKESTDDDDRCCSCGNIPSCISTYHPTCWWDEQESLGLIEPVHDMREALASIRSSAGDRSVEIRPWSGYMRSDAKLRNKAKRRHAGALSKKQSQRKQARLDARRGGDRDKVKKSKISDL